MAVGCSCEKALYIKAGKAVVIFFFQRKEGKIRGVLDVRLAWS